MLKEVPLLRICYFQNPNSAISVFPKHVHAISSIARLQGRQQDAEEFLGCVLNGAHEEMESAISAVSEPASNTTGVNGGAAGEAHKSESKKKAAIPNGETKTPEVRFFRGENGKFCTRVQLSSFFLISALILDGFVLA